MSIKLEQVSYHYNDNEIDEKIALKNINLTFEDRKFYAIVGKNGSGKSTLLKQLNGLLKPTKGRINIDNQIINRKSKEKQLIEIRKKVGLVFQNPNNQLFASNVLKDVSFGPIQSNVNRLIANNIAKEKLKLMGIDKSIYKKSPTELSGGQMRKVAIAGILVNNPKILVLDEPLVGLDPQNRIKIMHLLKDLQINHYLTIIIVTHYMDEIANFVDQMILMHNGEIMQQDTPQNIFQFPEKLNNLNLSAPLVTNFALKWFKKLNIHDKQLPVNEQQLKQLIFSMIGRKK